MKSEAKSYNHQRLPAASALQVNGMACNARVLAAEVTGVQRYLREVLAHADHELPCFRPSNQWSRGIHGHAWEQIYLPRLIGQRLLWSPGGTGPMFLRHQVVTVHDMMQLDHPQYFSRAFAKWYGFLVPRVIRISRKVLTMSEYVKARVLHYVPEAAGKIKVIALGASKAFRPYNAGEIAAARQQVAIPSARYLVSVASLVSHKNLRRVLEAWGRVVDQIAPDVYLVLVGSVGPRRIFQVPELGALPARVVCVGHLDDKLLAPVVAGAMALVYVSLHEGFGLPPLEAMSAGVPCIVSNTTALPEVVGDAALTVDPCSTAEVAAGMQRVLEDEGLRRELSGRSRERAAQFSWETTATLTFETLRECA